MSISDNEGGKGDTIEIPVYANNNIPIKKFLVPFQYPGNLELILIGANTVGCRTVDFEVQTYLWYDPGGKQFYYRLETTSDLLPPGSGPILKLKFMIPEDADDNDSAIFSLIEFAGKPPKYSGPLLEYEPVTIDAKIAVTPCCVGTRGDANGDGFPNANILDLNFLVNYIFRSSGDPGPCLPESNVNGDGTALPNVLDVNFLVNYIFRLGPAPGSC